MGPAAHTLEPDRIRDLRNARGLSQADLAAQLGVSQVTVSRWENGHNRPTPSLAARLQEILATLHPPPGSPTPSTPPGDPRPTDFLASPEGVLLVAEAERLSHAHLYNPAFAIEASLVDPLPHQRIAVYEHLLPQDRLRFLLADDAGAGKTIMAGLYLREMLSRRRLRRILVVPPAGLIGNWRSELAKFFRLDFRIVRGSDAKDANPFAGAAGDRVIVSVDTLASPRVFARIAEAGVEPYDLVIFDEAHKLSANRRDDLSVTKTDRYRLAEALAGVRPADPEFRLPWSAAHLLLLTATPHMGKDVPYAFLWRLLEPDLVPTVEAFRGLPPEERRRHFLRRLKEEMVHADGSPLYTRRQPQTPRFSLETGPESEQEVYDRATQYLREAYNRAAVLNRQAARLVLGVYQRRLASSTWAFLCSLERHAAKLRETRERLRCGQLSERELREMVEKTQLAGDPFEATPDEEGDDDGTGFEGHERSERSLLETVLVTTLVDLETELAEVRTLADLARQVLAASRGVKFAQLLALLRDPEAAGEKLLVFTEHRDTLVWLERELSALGFLGRLATIHGGMDFREREAQVAQFRRPDGAQILLATDAAGEGINLQFCWRMVNWDIPWNPARLEQRMGRIHRYGQQRDVVIVNLVADGTREAKVLRTLVDKLDTIRTELSSEKVFDVLGRLLAGVDLPQLLAGALLDDGAAAEALERSLTADAVTAIERHERELFGDGGDVARELPRLREELSVEAHRRLLPGYLRAFLERTAPALGLAIEGDLDTHFALRGSGARLGPLWEALESYPPELRHRLSLRRPAPGEAAVFLHPEEPVFQALVSLVRARFGQAARQGAAFVDPEAEEPYLLHVAEVSWSSAPGDGAPPVETHLVALRHPRRREPGAFSLVPVERLLLLRGAARFPVEQAGFAAEAEEWSERAATFLDEALLDPHREELRARAARSAEERRGLVERGFVAREAELAQRRAHLRERAEAGHERARQELEQVRRLQRELAAERQATLDEHLAAPGRIEAGEVRWIARALVVPSADPEERARHDGEAERVAMAVVRAAEEARGARVHDVSTPPKARAAGLTDHPGFDLLARFPGGTDLAIEVKGRAGRGDVELKRNEWAAALNHGSGYQLVVVFDCASPTPVLYRIPDPFARLVAKETGALRIPMSEIVAHAEETPR